MEKETKTIKIPQTEYEAMKAAIAELRAENAELLSKVEWFMEQFRLPHFVQPSSDDNGCLSL